MARIPRARTGAEREVARLFREAGLRFRYNVRSLPGSPDLANKHRALAVFVHGCFWHGHAGCERATLPKANRWWWRTKVRENRDRDERKTGELRRMGYRVVIVWECEMRKIERLRRRVSVIAEAQEAIAT